MQNPQLPDYRIIAVTRYGGCFVSAEGWQAHDCLDSAHGSCAGLLWSTSRGRVHEELDVIWIFSCWGLIASAVAEGSPQGHCHVFDSICAEPAVTAVAVKPELLELVVSAPCYTHYGPAYESFCVCCTYRRL